MSKQRIGKVVGTGHVDHGHGDKRHAAKDIQCEQPLLRMHERGWGVFTGGHYFWGYWAAHCSFLLKG